MEEETVAGTGWSTEEDNKLSLLAEKHHKSFIYNTSSFIRQVAGEFPGRTPIAIRSRARAIGLKNRIVEFHSTRKQQDNKVEETETKKICIEGTETHILEEALASLKNVLKKQRETLSGLLEKQRKLETELQRIVSESEEQLNAAQTTTNKIKKVTDELALRGSTVCQVESIVDAF